MRLVKIFSVPKKRGGGRPPLPPSPGYGPDLGAIAGALPPSMSMAQQWHGNGGEPNKDGAVDGIFSSFLLRSHY